MSQALPGAQPDGIKVGPIWLVPGVSRLNARIFIFAAYMTIGLLVYNSIGVPYLLQQVLNVPVSDQGRIIGDLQFLSEIILLLTFGPAGILADRIGRRQVYAIGLGFMGLGYVMLPLSSTLTELFIWRGVLGLGIALATGMLATVIADYPQDRSRRAMVAAIGILNGLGVVTVALTLGRLPNILVSGYDFTPEAAGRATFWLVAGLCFLVAIAVARGLQPGTPVKSEDRLPVRELAVSGIVEGIRNPRIALAYASAFVARADLVILGSFLVLWGQVAGIERGMDTAAASAAGSRLFFVASLAALLWLPILAWMLRRFNRVTGVAFCMAITAAAYGSMILVGDPLAPSAVGWFVFLGIGQISAFLGSTVLIGFEAPPKSRGAVVGVFNIFGAIGILIGVAVGGRVFDAIAPWAPFMFVCIIATLCVIMAVIVRIVSPGSERGAGADDDEVAPAH
ncbi:MAG: MFS transporter [Chromatiales bacterium]|nr:MFS transporter [Chromatiales bacterium]